MYFRIYWLQGNFHTMPFDNYESQKFIWQATWDWSKNFFLTIRRQ